MKWKKTNKIHRQWLPFRRRIRLPFRPTSPPIRARSAHKKKTRHEVRNWVIPLLSNYAAPKRNNWSNSSRRSVGMGQSINRVSRQSNSAPRESTTDWIKTRRKVVRRGFNWVKREKHSKNTRFRKKEPTKIKAHHRRWSNQTNPTRRARVGKSSIDRAVCFILCVFFL